MIVFYHYLYGDQDQVVLPEHLIKAKKFLKVRNFNVKTTMFKKCEHKIPREGVSLGLEFTKKFFIKIKKIASL